MSAPNHRGAHGYHFYIKIKGTNSIDYIDLLPTNHIMPNGSLYSRLLRTTLEKHQSITDFVSRISCIFT